jgi:hypothetical protein
MPTKTILFTDVGTSSFTVPGDFGSLVSFEAIGGGGGGAGFLSRAAGGGGGAYAKSTFSNNLAPGKVLQVFVGAGGNPSFFSNGEESYVRDPSNSFYYILAAGAAGGDGSIPGQGGQIANCVGSGPFYSGGNGGTATQTHSKGGGGGAGGPGGNGGTGGPGIGGGSTTQGGGGGGGAGGIAAGSNGATGVQGTRGGNGGADGNANPGGLGATTSTAATTPSLSNGGGGGGYGNSSSFTYKDAAQGGNSATIWTSVDGKVAAPGGGSGGGYIAANGGTYGGGSGGFFQDNGTGVGSGHGGQGLVAFTYNVAPNATATPYSVGQSGVANYVNTTSSAVTKVVADNGLGSYSPVVIGSGGGAANVPLVISANQANLRINVVDIAGYKTGISNITITVNAGVNVYSTSPTIPALSIYGENPGDTVTLVNNGNIMGYGGNGGIIRYTGSSPTTQAAVAGFTALSSLSNLTIVNNGNIGGGGGGGGATRDGFNGGGGAGGGTGNPDLGIRYISFSSPGPNGEIVNYPEGCCCNFQYYGGGNGGYIISTPTGGSIGTTSSLNYVYVGVGGNAGGSGSLASGGAIFVPGNDGGGTGNAPIPNNQVGPNIAGGGGGFGGSGSAGYSNETSTPFIRQVGAVGGYAINKNGKTVTVSGSGNIYGTQLP